MCRALERRGWLVCYAFMLAFFLVMVPSLAYADTYVATEDSAVRAAMVYLGYDPDEGESNNKLVTAFYDATSGDEYTGWQSFVNGLYQPLATVNYNEQWWSPADGFMFTAQVDRARSDAAKIYAAWKSSSDGGSGGGSSGPIVTEEYVYFSAEQVYPSVPDTAKFDYYRVSKTQYETALSNAQAHNLGESNLLIYNAPNANPRFAFIEDGAMVFHTVEETGTAGRSYVYTSTSGKYRYICECGSSFVDDPEHGRVLNLLLRSFVYTSNGGVDGAFPVYFRFGGSIEDEPTTPEPEPEPEPEPPTPDPVPPDPDTPTPEPPRDPTPPTPDPTQPSQTIDLQGIIDRLDIIIRNQAILINWLDDAFASVNANIQWLGSLFDNLTEWLSSINQNIQWLGELIDESFGWLWEVLDNLQGSIDGGITRITTWLEMIYNRIGGQGGTVSRPQIDTPTPWDDFLSWLEGILQRLLDLIFGVTPAALQNLLSGLADLTTKFPFSIPWDLAGLIALFVHDPMTPVFDLPLYMPSEGTIVNFHIDLSTWDDVMQIARDGEVLLFASWLIMATPDFYRHLNGVTGSD